MLNPNHLLPFRSYLDFRLLLLNVRSPSPSHCGVLAIFVRLLGLVTFHTYSRHVGAAASRVKSGIIDRLLSRRSLYGMGYGARTVGRRGYGHCGQGELQICKVP